MSHDDGEYVPDFARLRRLIARRSEMVRQGPVSGRRAVEVAASQRGEMGTTSPRRGVANGRSRQHAG